MFGPFVHDIDPIFFELGGVYLWFYGLSYTLGFLEIHLWFNRARRRLGLSLNEVYSLSLIFAASVIVGGRCVEVFFYEWPYYRAHLWHIPAVWLGGMATHGLLLGAVTGTWLFCRAYGKDFLRIADALVIPGAFLMGVGRIGNFIDGQILGSLTDVWWAVKFPDAEGFRHPVVLYDGIKNLLLIPLLLVVRRTRPPAGVMTAHFVFWYGFLRIFVDLYREYPTDLFGIATGQSFNIFMSVLGASLWYYYRRRRLANDATDPPPERPVRLWPKRAAFAGLLAFSLVMPSDWTQDIPARYGKRHPGLQYSHWYPAIAPAPAVDAAVPDGR